MIPKVLDKTSYFFEYYDTSATSKHCEINEKNTWFFGEVNPSSYLWQTEGLAGNSKPIYEVCDSKSEKSAPMYCFEGTPFTPVQINLQYKKQEPSPISLARAARIFSKTKTLKKFLICHWTSVIIQFFRFEKHMDWIFFWDITFVLAIENILVSLTR